MAYTAKDFSSLTGIEAFMKNINRGVVEGRLKT